MLPSQYRLPAPAVRLVLSKGKRISTKDFDLIFMKNSLTLSRFAFIVGIRVDKRATARNRTKRLLRESVRHLNPQIPSGFDYVFIAKTSLAPIKEQEVEKIVKKLIIP